MIYSTFSDGGARGNPGPAAIGIVVLEDDVEIHREGKVIGETTNNIAEYTALIEALTYVSNLPGDSKQVVCKLDSELVVKQLRGEYKIKNSDLALKAIEVTKLKNNFETIQFTHIPREQNSIADSLVNQALDESKSAKK